MSRRPASKSWSVRVLLLWPKISEPRRRLVSNVGVARFDRRGRHFEVVHRDPHADVMCRRGHRQGYPEVQGRVDERVGDHDERVDRREVGDEVASEVEPAAPRRNLVGRGGKDVDDRLEAAGAIIASFAFGDLFTHAKSGWGAPHSSIARERTSRTIVSMLLISVDGFVGLKSQRLVSTVDTESLLARHVGQEALTDPPLTGVGNSRRVDVRDDD